MTTPTEGDSIEIYWTGDEIYYPGVVGPYNALNGTFEIRYDDGEIEDLDLSKEQWRTPQKQSETRRKGRPKKLSTAGPSVVVFSPNAVAATSNNDLNLPSLPALSSSETTSRHSAIPNRRSKKASPRKKEGSKVKVQVSGSSEQCNHSTNSPETQEHKASALKLIENCVSRWLSLEKCRQKDMFSIHECLSYTYNKLTIGAVDPEYQSKLLQMKSARSRWLLTGDLPDSNRRLYNSWDRPHTDREWNSEKLMLAKISALVLKGSCGSCRLEIAESSLENESVEAMRYLLYAKERNKHAT